MTKQASYKERKDQLADGQYLIPHFNLGRLERYAERMNKRAKRLGLEIEPVKVLQIGSEEPLSILLPTREQEGERRPRAVTVGFLTVEIAGETPELPGWKFIGTVDRLPTDEGEKATIFRMLPGEEIPQAVKESPQFCDHCQTNRRRKMTYLVREEATGQIKQVGSTCIKDYVGHRNAEAVAAYMELYLLFVGLVNEDIDELDWEDADLQRAQNRYAEVERYLPWVALEVRLYGWVSGAEAWETAKTSSAQSAWSAMLDKRSEKDRPSDEDDETARKTIEWAERISEEDREANDYLYNLYQVIHTGLFDVRKHRGIVGSAVRVYQREEAKRLTAEAQLNEHFGELKKRYELTLTCTESRLLDTESQWGATTLQKFVDEEGHVFVWFASGAHDLEPGETGKVKATVKAHKEFRGQKETQINRVKLTEVIA